MKARFIAFSLPRRMIRSAPFSWAAFLGLLVLGAGVGYLGFSGLKNLFIEWKQLGDGILYSRLLFVLLPLWTGAGMLTLIPLFRNGFGELGTLLMTVSMPRGARWRGLLGLAYWEAGNMFILVLGMTAPALLTVMGVNGLPWVFLGLLWGLNVSWFMAFIYFFAYRYIFPYPKRLFAVGGVIAGLFVILFNAATGGLNMEPFSTGQVWIAVCVQALFLILALGPLSKFLDRLYINVYLFSNTRTPKLERKRLLSKITGFLKVRRTITFALLTRGFINRSRNWAGPSRVLLLLVGAVFFPGIIEKIPALYGPLALLLFLFIAVLFLVFDAEPSPIGSEGNRLAILLTIPIKNAVILWAKYRVFFFPLWIPILIAGYILGHMTRQPEGEILIVLLVFSVWLTGLAGIIAFGSAWDADLDLAIGPGLMALVHEEVPLTAKRAVLVFLGIIHSAIHVYLFLTFSAAACILTIIPLNAVVILLSWKAGNVCLEKLVS